jgi:hypothetical protein
MTSLCWQWLSIKQCFVRYRVRLRLKHSLHQSSICFYSTSRQQLRLSTIKDKIQFDKYAYIVGIYPSRSQSTASVLVWADVWRPWTTNNLLCPDSLWVSETSTLLCPWQRWRLTHYCTYMYDFYRWLWVIVQAKAQFFNWYSAGMTIGVFESIHAHWITEGEHTCSRLSICTSPVHASVFFSRGERQNSHQFHCLLPWDDKQVSEHAPSVGWSLEYGSGFHNNV